MGNDDRSKVEACAKRETPVAQTGKDEGHTSCVGCKHEIKNNPCPYCPNEYGEHQNYTPQTPKGEDATPIMDEKAREAFYEIYGLCSDFGMIHEIARSTKEDVIAFIRDLHRRAGEQHGPYETRELNSAFAEIVRLEKECDDWKRRAGDTDEILKAVDDEPELPGPIPLEFAKIIVEGDSNTLERVLRQVIKSTKQGIRERIKAVTNRRGTK